MAAFFLLLIALVVAVCGWVLSCVGGYGIAAKEVFPERNKGERGVILSMVGIALIIAACVCACIAGGWSR